MSEWAITEEQLGRVNRFLQSSGDQMIHNCLTRTAQESKLFPIMPYLQLNFFEAYYRFPDQLRRASEVISPEDCGHRARNATCNLGRLTSWGLHRARALPGPDHRLRALHVGLPDRPLRAGGDGQPS